MASTMTAGQAVSIVGLKYPKLLTESFAARFADEVQAFIWYRYPWRGSLSELPPFHLVKEEPDYGPPLLAVPGDFYGLHRAWVRSSTGQRVEPELLVKPEVSISSSTGLPTAIAYHSERLSFRVHPRPSVSAPDWWIEGTYKKLPTKITNENLNSYVLPWDDIYFQIFRRGLEWKVKDELIGTPDGTAAFAIFRSMVDDMAAAEGLHSGVVTVAPAEGLEMGG